MIGFVVRGLRWFLRLLAEGSLPVRPGLGLCAVVQDAIRARDQPDSGEGDCPSTTYVT